MGMLAVPPTGGNAKYKINRVPANAITKPAAPPNNESKQREQDAFGEGLPYNPSRLSPQRHAQRGLAPALQAANEHEIGYVGADDEQHKS